MPAHAVGKALLEQGASGAFVKLGVTGHQDIPAQGVPHVAAGIEAIFAALANPIVAISSLAAGADQLFANIAVKRGASLEVVLPCSRYEETFSREVDRAAFHRLLAAARTTHTLEFPEPSEQAFLEAGRVIVDLADEVVAVWDGKPSRGCGGTGDIVQYARDRGKRVVLVWPAALER